MSSASRKKFTSDLGEKIFPHKHCAKCEKMVPEYSDGFCSNNCRGIDKVKTKHQKKRMITWIGVGGALALIVILLLLIK